MQSNHDDTKEIPSVLEIEYPPINQEAIKYFSQVLASSRKNIAFEQKILKNKKDSCPAPLSASPTSPSITKDQVIEFLIKLEGAFSPLGCNIREIKEIFSQAETIFKAQLGVAYQSLNDKEVNKSAANIMIKAFKFSKKEDISGGLFHLFSHAAFNFNHPSFLDYLVLQCSDESIFKYYHHILFYNKLHILTELGMHIDIVKNKMSGLRSRYSEITHYIGSLSANFRKDDPNYIKEQFKIQGHINTIILQLNETSLYPVLTAVIIDYLGKEIPIPSSNIVDHPRKDINHVQYKHLLARQSFLNKIYRTPITDDKPIKKAAHDFRIWHELYTILTPLHLRPKNTEETDNQSLLYWLMRDSGGKQIRDYNSFLYLTEELDEAGFFTNGSPPSRQEFDSALEKHDLYKSIMPTYTNL
jgi:hypothetical protein